jgi:hypothetical protein
MPEIHGENIILFEYIGNIGEFPVRLPRANPWTTAPFFAGKNSKKHI